MWVVLLLTSLALTVSAEEAGAPARSAATSFGQALESADTRSLARHFPTSGRVRLQLDRLVGREHGFYSSQQVVTLLRTFLQEGSVDGFTVIAVEAPTEQFARVDATARITNHKGVTRPATLRLHLERERDRWVVRELREEAP
ncbi:MAG: hypothetical protein OEV00_14650 [Acidobacteriota bacterium]|nr:hypothetical protein [Acidobacteriota bacterium]